MISVACLQAQPQHLHSLIFLVRYARDVSRVAAMVPAATMSPAASDIFSNTMYHILFSLRKLIKGNVVDLGKEWSCDRVCETFGG